MSDQSKSDSWTRALMRRMHAPIYEKRIAVLSQTIAAQLRPNDVVLDVGCGSGLLGKAISMAPACPAGVRVQGLENHKRGGEAIEVTAYDGRTFPFADRSVDVVILADVLHHEETPERLVAESIRVSRRLVIIKDHKVDGLLAQARISFLDWSANVGYQVKCLFRYNTLPQWTEFFRKFPVRVAHEIRSIDLYPAMFNLVFGKKLHYLAVLETNPPGVPPR